MTPAFRAVGNEGSEATVQITQAESDQIVQEAFRQGMEYASRHYQQQQEESLGAQRQEELGALQTDNGAKERALADAIDALHKREYQAPIQPMPCKAERQAVLECYKAQRNGEAGELVAACEQTVRKLDECATIVRLAAAAKIVPGSLPEE